MTFDTWHLVILFDLVQGIMLASQGKVLSPRNEGSRAVAVYVYLFPQILLYLCSHANFRVFSLFYWCNSMYMPNARVSVCTVRQPTW